MSILSEDVYGASNDECPECLVGCKSFTVQFFYRSFVRFSELIFLKFGVQACEFFFAHHFTSSSLLAPYPGEGSAVRIRRLQKFLSSASSGPTRSSRMSRFTRSRHLPLGLPLGRHPGISMSITCLRLLSCSLRCTCPNHLSLLSLALLFILPTPSSFLISSLFILSFTVTPLILLSILISVFSRIFSSFTPVVQHSAPYKMTGLTTVVYSLVFNFVGIFLSAITGPSSLHFCHPAFTLALTAVSDPPSSLKVTPRYLN